jgi:hypothetical protein
LFCTWMFLFVHNKRSSFYPTAFQSNLQWYVIKASFTHGSTFCMWRSLQFGKGTSMCGRGLDTKKNIGLLCILEKVSQMVHFARCTLSGVAHWGLMWRQNPLSTAHFLSLKAKEHHEISREQCLKQHCCRIASKSQLHLL